jgi:hypothetical protein
MELLLRRQPPGYIYWPLTLMTLGLVALLILLGERHFIRRMDTTGVFTRGGRRIAWKEFTAIERSQGMMKDNVLSDEYILKSSKGKVSLPIWRTENWKEALVYMSQHLPPGLLIRDAGSAEIHYC